MPDQSTTILICKRCNYIWHPRHPTKLPKSCPNCKSLAWNKPLTDYWREVRQNNQTIKQEK